MSDRGHWEVWEKRLIRWCWVASTPHHTDLVSIIQHGEAWLKTRQHRVIWVEEGETQ